MVTALRHLSRAREVTWIATAAGEDDRFVARRQRERGGRIGGEHLRLRLVDVEQALYEDYCGEFCNRVLWFAQHGLWRRRLEAESHARVRALFARYLEATRAFAEAVVAEAHRPGPTPLVLAQDYHLYALPRAVRARLPGVAISHFLHIPWPRTAELREALPDDVLGALIEGLLGADVVGFQDPASCANFADAAERLLGSAARVGAERVEHESGTTLLRVRPVSIERAELRPNPTRAAELRADPRRLLVRVDRIDPIKNIPLGFRAYATLLERHPELVGRIRFIARLVPSRSTLFEYRNEAAAAQALAHEINRRFGAGSVEVSHAADRGRALAELAAADAVLVNSIADGMNLVAKEAAVLNDRLALVLSRRAGAHAELGEGAIGIEPESLESTVAGLEAALAMDEPERRRRSALLRAAVARWTSKDWTEALLGDLAEAVAARRAG